MLQNRTQIKVIYGDQSPVNRATIAVATMLTKRVT